MSQPSMFYTERSATDSEFGTFDLFASTIDLYQGVVDPYQGHNIAAISHVPAPAACSDDDGSCATAN